MSITQYNESLAESTTTSTTPTAKVSTTLNPQASTNYLILWSALIANGGTSAPTIVRLRNQTGSTTECENTRTFGSASEYTPVGGQYVYEAGGSPSAQTFAIEFSVGTTGQTGKIKDARILIIPLGDDDEFVSVDADTTYNNAFAPTDAATLTFTPPSTDDYLIIATAELGNISGTANMNATELFFAPSTSFANFNTDPADKSPNITLSNSNLTATGGAGANFEVVRATVSRVVGKYYNEFTINAVGGGISVGLANSEMALSNSLMIFGNATGYASGGTVTAGGTNLGSIGSYTSGDRIDMAVDFDNLRIWFRKNGGNWNNSGTANPATNTGGLNFSTMVFSTSNRGNTAYPTVDLAGPGCQVTANFGATAYGGTPPSGFANWVDTGNGLVRTRATNDRVSWFAMMRPNLGASSQSFKIRTWSDFSNAKTRRARITALRMSRFGGQTFERNRSRAVTTSTTPVTLQSLSFTPVPQEHIVIASMLIDASNATDETSFRLSDGVTTFSQGRQRSVQTSDRNSYFVAFSFTPPGSPITYADQYWESGFGTAGADEGVIVAIQTEPTIVPSSSTGGIGRGVASGVRRGAR